MPHSKTRLTFLSNRIYRRGEVGIDNRDMTAKRPGGKGGPQPTEMGRRILAFMTANQLENKAHFAEKVLGISRQTFHAWLYREMDAGKIAARPILQCADALSTNPEYLLCITNDPRPAAALAVDEDRLLDAFRTMDDSDRDKLLSIAADWSARSANGGKSAAAPFRVPSPARHVAHEPSTSPPLPRKKDLTGR